MSCVSYFAEFDLIPGQIIDVYLLKLLIKNLLNLIPDTLYIYAKFFHALHELATSYYYLYFKSLRM